MRDKPRFFSHAHMFATNEMNEGRSTFFWKERISSSWGTYFVTYERFLAASYQLELLLELNSHAATNVVKDVELQVWIEANISHIYYSYVPDLFAQSLELAVPMADKLYDAILITDP